MFPTPDENGPAGQGIAQCIAEIGLPVTSHAESSAIVTKLNQGINPGEARWQVWVNSSRDRPHPQP